MLEFQAQANRRGSQSVRISPKTVAADLLQQLVSDQQLTLRRIPDSFIPETADKSAFQIPAAGRLTLLPPDLFSGSLRGTIRSHELSFANANQAGLVGLLAKHGIIGTVELPVEAGACAETTSAILQYLEGFDAKFEHAVSGVSSDNDLQRRIQREALNLLIHSHEES